MTLTAFFIVEGTLQESPSPGARRGTGEDVCGVRSRPAPVRATFRERRAPAPATRCSPGPICCFVIRPPGPAPPVAPRIVLPRGFAFGAGRAAFPLIVGCGAGGGFESGSGDFDFSSDAAVTGAA